MLYNDGMDCYQINDIMTANARVQVPEVKIIFDGSGVPLKNGTPPAGSWPSYIDSVTMQADTNFTGGAYLWSTTSNKVTLSNTTTATVTVKSVSASAARNDVTIKVVWTINGKLSIFNHTLVRLGA